MPQSPPVSWAGPSSRHRALRLPSPWHCPEDLSAGRCLAGPLALVKDDSGRSLLLGVTLCSALGPGVGHRTGESLLYFCLFLGLTLNAELSFK